MLEKIIIENTGLEHEIAYFAFVQNDSNNESCAYGSSISEALQKISQYLELKTIINEFNIKE